MTALVCIAQAQGGMSTMYVAKSRDAARAARDQAMRLVPGCLPGQRRFVYRFGAGRMEFSRPFKHRKPQKLTVTVDELRWLP